MGFTEDTQNHVIDVNKVLQVIISELSKRGKYHDYSKFSDEEWPIFQRVLDKQETAKFGTPEYEEVKKELAPALNNHYKENRHHPEHFIDGIHGMNLVDLLEMLADWSAATKRHKDDNILNSIEFNSKKYEISDQLKTILINTVNDYFL